jgi:PD-(D/E)XK endonuclease
MFDKCNTTRSQGNIGLAEAIAYFCRNGNTVSLPLTENQDYDLVVELDGKLKKVQVKTTRYKTEFGIYFLSLSSTGGNSKVNKIHRKGKDIVYDLLFVLTADGDKYLIPKEVLGNSVNLGDRYQQYRVGS